MNKTFKVCFIITAALTLTACTHTQPATPSNTQPSQVQSTGDPSQDLQTIESELDSLDSNTDFPDFTAEDFNQ